MTLILTPDDLSMLNGDRGPAAEMAMSIIVEMADVFAAECLMDISAAHIDSTIYIGEAGLEFAEKLTGLGAKVKVPSTVNVSGVDEHHWQEWPVPVDWAANASRQMQAYLKMDCIPTWTCAPYQTDHRPAFGQQIAWGESNAVVFANSVIGARTERYPDLLDICCAIAGRVPAVGLHLTENRAGQVVFNLIDIPAKVQVSDTFYPVLGHLLGKFSRDRIPVIQGMVVTPQEDQFKSLGAAAASSGAVALFHMVGLTPEAPTLTEALQGNQPQETFDITLDDLLDARDELTTLVGEDLNMVVLGSPHFSLAEFSKLAPLLQGKQVHNQVSFLVTTSRAMAHLAEKAGFLAPLKDFGGKITVDTCILATPMLPPHVNKLMTNSAKYAYYAPSLLDTKVAFGTLEDCVQSAVAGQVVQDGQLWRK